MVWSLVDGEMRICIAVENRELAQGQQWNKDYFLNADKGC